MSQLALAWMQSRGEQVIALPGTTQLAHLAENLGAVDVRLGDDVLQRLDALINRHSVHGARQRSSARSTAPAAAPSSNPVSTSARVCRRKTRRDHATPSASAAAAPTPSSCGHSSGTAKAA